MYERFMNLDDEKRKRIVNGAIDEFLKNGYDKTSVNDIVEQVGIAKGSVFYYFESKKKMYLFLYRYCKGLMRDILEADNFFEERDLLKRIEHFFMASKSVFSDYPQVMKFMGAAKMEKSKTVEADIAKISKDFVDNIETIFFENIDLTLFKNPDDFEKIIYTIQIVLTTQFDELVKDGAFDCEEPFKNTLEFLNFFRASFYK